MTTQTKTGKRMMIETNRRLQETSQKLFMAKQELEEKNRELEKARRREHEQKIHLQRELNTLKRLAGNKADEEAFREEGPRPEKKLNRAIAEDLSLRYIQLLESYIQTKDLDKNGPLAEEYCQKSIEYGITPKGIIDIHLKAVPQMKTIGDLETKRAAYESRMVLLKVMTQYASLIIKNKET